MSCLSVYTALYRTEGITKEEFFQRINTQDWGVKYRNRIDDEVTEDTSPHTENWSEVYKDLAELGKHFPKVKFQFFVHEDEGCETLVWVHNDQSDVKPVKTVRVFPEF